MKKIRIVEAVNRLYHVTNYESATNILEHDYFRTTFGGISGIRGLSTTTDPTYFWGSKDVRFIIDRNLIGRDYNLVDVDEKLIKASGKPLEEFEVVVEYDRAILNAHLYINKIEVYKYNDALLDILEIYAEKYQIEYERF